MDQSSYANCDELNTTHMHLNVTVDFDHRTIMGTNEITLNAIKDGVSEVVLDY